MLTKALQNTPSEGILFIGMAAAAMMNLQAHPGDLFTGSWKLCPEVSRLGNRVPQSWTQRLEVTGDAVSVQEEMVFAGGAVMKTAAAAKFDGRDYPVQGSPLADTMAYTRVNEFQISGTGKKGGVITLTETAAVSSDGNTLTLTFCLHPGTPQAAESSAVFRRQPDTTLTR
ncbi:MAG TPA: hypothetical protein VGR48_07050 [Terriglobales bacterium]|nr:hypothetical protein [Terriglobales bacterium]